MFLFKQVTLFVACPPSGVRGPYSSTCQLIIFFIHISGIIALIWHCFSYTSLRNTKTVLACPPSGVRGLISESEIYNRVKNYIYNQIVQLLIATLTKKDCFLQQSFLLSNNILLKLIPYSYLDYTVFKFCGRTARRNSSLIV